MIRLKHYANVVSVILRARFNEYRARRVKKFWIFSQVGGGTLRYGIARRGEALREFGRIYPNSPIIHIDVSLAGYAVIVHGNGTKNER